MLLLCVCYIFARFLLFNHMSCNRPREGLRADLMMDLCVVFCSEHGHHEPQNTDMSCYCIAATERTLPMSIVYVYTSYKQI